MRHALLHVRMYLKWYILAVLCLTSLTLWSVVLHEDRKGILTVAVLNIGQGSSTFIESPTGTQVLVDGGPGNTLMKEIPQVIPWYDRHIDMLINTNPDKDHYEGFIPLLDKYSVDVFMEAGTVTKVEAFALLKHTLMQKKIPDLIARRGEAIDLGGGAYIEILFPDRDVSGLSSNDGSIVARLVYGSTSMLIQGDATSAIEQYLLTLPDSKLKSDVIVVGHHGSRTSSSETYIQAVAPQYALISSGVKNSYGHPHTETLQTLATLHVPALDTCAMGRIIFHSDGQKFTMQNRSIVPVRVGCK